ncbi:bifunctional 4-hydroxy-2-oxoglutarate aldolase/2-dehydro-3-deoxy-phosphogluconate aldolase [Agromyces sp. SYSU T0242]|uniref:bifunctional 4-hydroxy-2-oxoglutarate aldolase/2-dehydro-3-deoxy-phosphogluconate aldolase n=1 Tax=Agromyces litoreus TaxID=3158561 RepID=UPI003399F952
MTDVGSRIAELRVLPVVVARAAADAAALGDGLVEGGLPVAEVTFRTPVAAEVIGALAARGDLLVGAGTVTTIAQLDRAVDAGACFIVSPGLDDDLVTACLERGVAVYPGIATASELQRAVKLGLGTVKLFPASLLGGSAAIDALAAPFGDVRFLPSGGITLADAPEYLRRPAVDAVCGSWMVKPDLVERGADAVREAVRRTVEAVGQEAGR